MASAVEHKDYQAAAEAVFREERARIVASLIRLSGSFDLAEDAMQDAFATAIATWPDEGTPANAPAWITAVARRKLIDRLRRASVRREKGEQLARELPHSTPPLIELNDDMGFPDDRLRLIFTCCHPALNPDAQIALTLRTLGGLSTEEIAKAFLVPESTLAQRLVRVKRKIEQARIPYEVPSRDRLPERLAAVQSVVYLIFNEGYAATSGDRLTREDLSAEAIRLGRILVELMPEEPENIGLLALMLLHDSRRLARTRNGRLITLDDQDRSLWDRSQIDEGLALLVRVRGQGEPGPYRLQATIAAEHARARSAGDTDWWRIASLYEALLAQGESPVIRLNYATAVCLSGEWQRGLGIMDELATNLDHYYLLHAARADMLRRLGRINEARTAYERALELVNNDVERDYLLGRLRSLSAKTAD